MEDSEKLFWFIGLFEGEGTFNINKNSISKRISITSTDKDVLERCIELFGGTIIEPKNRNEKWKKPYVWYINREKSIEITMKMYLYLSERRKKRASEFIEFYSKSIEKENLRKQGLKSKIDLIIKLKNEGLKHIDIGKQVGFERSHVSKILKIHS